MSLFKSSLLEATSICDVFGYYTSSEERETPDQSDQSSDDVFEAVGGVAGQPHALAATTQVLAVRPLHVNVPLLLLTAAAGLRAALRQSEWKKQEKSKQSEGCYS